MADSPAQAFPHRHLLGLTGLPPGDIVALLDAAEARLSGPHGGRTPPTLAGRTQINLFFEPSTRTQASFEIAGRRLGADVLNVAVATSSVVKGESLVDTAATLNAMAPDILVVRHQRSGAVQLLSRHVDCCVVNAGDGAHEHPTQALLDALTIRRHKGRIEGLVVAICGDVAHSRVARSNIFLLSALGARVRLVGPPTLMPSDVGALGVEVFGDLEAGLAGVDIVMALRLQLERMSGAYVPSPREYARFWGLSEERLARARPDVLVMHPGPINRGVEIETAVADGPRSLVTRQVEAGVAVRMAVLDALARNAPARSSR